MRFHVHCMWTDGKFEEFEVEEQAKAGNEGGDDLGDHIDDDFDSIDGKSRPDGIRESKSEDLDGGAEVRLAGGSKAKRSGKGGWKGGGKGRKGRMAEKDDADDDDEIMEF